jgi:hypothetical protein
MLDLFMVFGAGGFHSLLFLAILTRTQEEAVKEAVA